MGSVMYVGRSSVVVTSDPAENNVVTSFISSSNIVEITSSCIVVNSSVVVFSASVISVCSVGSVDSVVGASVVVVVVVVEVVDKVVVDVCVVVNCDLGCGRLLRYNAGEVVVLLVSGVVGVLPLGLYSGLVLPIKEGTVLLGFSVVVVVVVVNSSSVVVNSSVLFSSDEVVNSSSEVVVKSVSVIKLDSDVESSLFSVVDDGRTRNLIILVRFIGFSSATGAVSESVVILVSGESSSNLPDPKRGTIDTLSSSVSVWGFVSVNLLSWRLFSVLVSGKTRTLGLLRVVFSFSIVVSSSFVVNSCGFSSSGFTLGRSLRMIFFLLIIFSV